MNSTQTPYPKGGRPPQRSHVLSFSIHIKPLNVILIVLIPILEYEYSNMTEIVLKMVVNRTARSGQWSFEQGLSYTEFKYGEFTVCKAEFTTDNELTFSVETMRCGIEALIIHCKEDKIWENPNI